MNRSDIERAVSALSSTSPTKQFKAMVALSRYGSDARGALGQLRHCLGSTDRRGIRHRSQQLGQKAAETMAIIGPEAVPYLCESIRSDVDIERIHAAHGLKLIAYYQSDPRGYSVPSHLKREMVECLIRATEDKVSRVREFASKGLSILLDRESVPSLIRLLDDGDSATQYYALLGLQRISGEAFGYDSSAWSSWWVKAKGKQRGHPLEVPVKTQKLP